MLTLAIALALGVGASDSNSITVRINGKETHLTLAGVSGGSPSGAAFANCLVAGRVLRVSGPSSAATVKLLDDTSVGMHVGEFLQTKTMSDPCMLGKAAYQPAPLHAAAAPAKGKAAPAAAATNKQGREVHVSFGGGEMNADSLRMPASAVAPEYGEASKARVAAAPTNQPTYANPVTVQMYNPVTTNGSTMPSASTNTGLAQGTSQTGLDQHGTEQMEPHQTETIPTTTYPPPPQ